jgi:hypothetical protein
MGVELILRSVRPSGGQWVQAGWCADSAEHSTTGFAVAVWPQRWVCTVRDLDFARLARVGQRLDHRLPRCARASVL